MGGARGVVFLGVVVEGDKELCERAFLLILRVDVCVCV